MTLDCAVATTQFDIHWKNKQYSLALAAYYAGGRPFWLTDMVAGYYERRGLINKAMQEYAYLIDEYLKISPTFLPLPSGPSELFKLAKWYASRDKEKAIRYLKLYLSAQEVWKGDPALHLPNKAEAKRILNKLVGYAKRT